MHSIKTWIKKTEAKIKKTKPECKTALSNKQTGLLLNHIAVKY